MRRTPSDSEIETKRPAADVPRGPHKLVSMLPSCRCFARRVKRDSIVITGLRMSPLVLVEQRLYPAREPFFCIISLIARGAQSPDRRWNGIARLISECAERAAYQLGVPSLPSPIAKSGVELRRRQIWHRRATRLEHAASVRGIHASEAADVFGRGDSFSRNRRRLWFVQWLGLRGGGRRSRPGAEAIVESAGARRLLIKSVVSPRLCAGLSSEERRAVAGIVRCDASAERIVRRRTSGKDPSAGMIAWCRIGS